MNSDETEEFKIFDYLWKEKEKKFTKRHNVSVEGNEWRVQPIKNQWRAMGNSYSHQQIPVGQWTQSYPRLRHGQHQIKVLPERVPVLNLRTTDNGAILQNGGTISSRKQKNSLEEKIYRPRSSSAHRPSKLEGTTLDKSRFGSEPDLRFSDSRDPQFGENPNRQRISRSRKKYKAPPAPQNGMNSGLETSSPDLSNWETNGKDLAGGFCRKGRLFKTRAETNKKNLTTLRTQKKKESEISRSTEALHITKQKFREEMIPQTCDNTEKKRLKRSASQEVISTKKSLVTPEFQAEILEAAQRLRSAGVKTRDSPQLGKTNVCRGQTKNEVFESLKIEIPSEKDFEEKKKIPKMNLVEEVEKKSQKTSEPCRSWAEGLKEKNNRDVPFKKFYFGMEESDSKINVVNNNASTNNVNKTNAEHRLTAVEKCKNFKNLCKSGGEREQEWEVTVDKFAANFHKAQISLQNGNTTSCSSSFVSDPDEDVDGGIALQLRPTLPKKILEIPRFSPTAAWRLLSSIDPNCSQAPSPEGSDDTPILLEEGIQPPEPQHGLRNGHDKSGDSGISGDASPGGCQESSSEIAVASPKAIPAQKSENIVMAWTPQQDLEEESSSEDLESPLNSSKITVCKIPGARFSPRNQLFVSRDPSFSVSSPKEDKICFYTENGDFKEKNNIDLTSRLNNLKMIKVALGSTKRNDISEELINSSNDNWVLSRSVLCSLNNSHIAALRNVSNSSSPEQEDEYNQQASYSYLANGGRIMYLPEYHSKMSPDLPGKKPKNTMSGGFLSKSCENITKQIERPRTPSPSVLRYNNETKFLSEVSKSNSRKKKFTFQSTVRLLENRRLAEKLSREAELKENQRLSELEAMKKVEEEFQKKRAREKATIRHQLRLFSLEEKNYSSLPPIQLEENVMDADGSPASLPQVTQHHPSKKLTPTKKTSVMNTDKFTPTTQILSEFREPTRNYKDYRHSRCHEHQESLSENLRRSVVEHPRVVCDMPKNTAVYISAPVNFFAQSQCKDETRAGLSTPRSSSSDNYRKDFAHGARPNAGRSFTSSDSDLSQSHPRPSSRLGLLSRGFTALHRSRSTSPDSIIQGSDALDNSSKSRSGSPVKTVTSHKSRSVSPNGSIEVRKRGELPQLEQISSKRKYERKMSNPTEYHTNVLKVVPANNDKHDFCGKIAMDSFLRLGVSSLRPYNKAEKSFRPINFNPVPNKLAQTVT